MIRAVLLTVALATPFGAHAQDALIELQNRLAPHQVIRADFVQTKDIAAMTRPLRSSGRVVVSRQHGVLWQIESPFKMTYILAENRIVEIGADGSRRTRQAHDLPGVAQVAQIFRALLGGQKDALNRYFEAKSLVGGKGWSIELKPAQAQLAQYISHIQLNGGDYVQAIRIDEASGDRTLIEFEHSSGAQTLSPAELLQFGTPSSQ